MTASVGIVSARCRYGRFVTKMVAVIGLLIWPRRLAWRQSEGRSVDKQNRGDES